MSRSMLCGVVSWPLPVVALARPTMPKTGRRVRGETRREGHPRRETPRQTGHWGGPVFQGVTDASFKELVPLKNLNALFLLARRYGHGFEGVRTVKNLNALFLNHTEVTDAGLKEFAHSKTSPDTTCM